MGEVVRAAIESVPKGQFEAAQAQGFSYLQRMGYIILPQSIPVMLPPMVNQVETHVFNQQIEAQQIMEQYGTHIMAWGPFAEGRNNYFSNPVLKAVGGKYGKSVAQTALRFLIQRGVIVIPKSTHKNRMEENLNVFDFHLSAEDMEAIGKLDKGRSLFF